MTRPWTAGATCFLFTTFLAVAARPAEPPNILFVFADDLGYADIGCYGCPDARTPRIDELAAEGVRFTQFYANGPECTPTRTALFTGRYQQRVGGLECAIGTGNVGRYDDAIRLAKRHELGLPARFSVLPEKLKKGGYAAGVFGKWHLGYEKQFWPLRHGFDTFLGVLGGNCDYFTHREYSDIHVLYEDDRPVERSGYLTHLITEEALDFLRKKHGKPFFLYASYTTPHFPYQGPGDADVPMTEEKFTQGTRGKYVVMLEDLDAQVGRLIDALEESGLSKNTLVIFASDNGGTRLACHGPYSGTKGGLFEGGIRVPLVIRWPGHIPAGKVSSQMCITMDLTASILRVAGSGASDDRPLDGIDIIAHVEDEKPDFDRTLFWRARRGDRTWRAVRDGSLKYVRRVDGPRSDEWLFHLEQDAGEKNNLLETRPQEGDRLRKLLADWEEEVRAAR